MKERITKLISQLSEGLHEREEVIAVSLLSTLSGQSVFLYGLPGTAKSLIARRLAQIFKDSTHFEYLMQKFSTPEEVFGPVSIHELKEDRYIRKTNGYLPTADFAFLDEIWKSSPAILNTLLTIINERIFRNGDKEEKVPLKGLIVASNETPPSNQGLEALYDRFITRIMVSPMEKRENFESLLNSRSINEDINIEDSFKFDDKEWKELFEKILNVKLSKEVLNIIHSIRVLIDNYNKTNNEKSIYVSDRRWQKIATLLKAGAFFCDRKEVIVVDTMLLHHCLWTTEENKDDISNIIEKSIEDAGNVDRDNLDNWILEYKDLEEGINETFYHTQDIYEIEKIQDEKCFPFEFSIKEKDSWNSRTNNIKIKVYIPQKYFETDETFTPFKEDGTFENRLQCNFNNKAICKIKVDRKVSSNGWDSSYRDNKYEDLKDFSPKIKVKKGTQKSITARTKNAYERDCEKLVADIHELIVIAEKYMKMQSEQNDSPFISLEKREKVLSNIENYKKELENHKLNAEHQLKKVTSYAFTK